MKLRSLMFRELRLSRKSIILQFGLLLAWIALTWGMLLSSGANGITREELLGTADVIIMMTALIGAMSLLLDDVFKADINSGFIFREYLFLWQSVHSIFRLQCGTARKRGAWSRWS